MSAVVDAYETPDGKLAQVCQVGDLMGTPKFDVEIIDVLAGGEVVGHIPNILGLAGLEALVNARHWTRA